MDYSTVQQKAVSFLNLTYFNLGTEEKKATDILQEINKADAIFLFETAIRKRLGEKTSQKLFTIYHEDSLVRAILKKEMSGSALARAQDMYVQGEETYRASGWEYFLEGIVTPLDLTSGMVKGIALAGIAFTGLAAITPALAVTLGSWLALGTFGYGVVTTIKNGIEIARSSSEKEVKENLRDLGVSITTILLSAPLVPKSVRVIRKQGVKL